MKRPVPDSFRLFRPLSAVLPGISLMLGILWVSLCVSGCAVKKQSVNLTELNQYEQQLNAEPNPQVNMEEVKEAAQYFEEEDQSLKAMTAEKFGKRFKLACLKLVRLEPNEEIAVALFEEGVQFFEDGNYEEAAKKLGMAGFRWPDTPLQEDALFLRAESYFFANRYSKAQRAYEKLLKKFESTRYMDRVSPRLFAIAQYWEKLDQIHDSSELVPK